MEPYILAFPRGAQRFRYDAALTFIRKRRQFATRWHARERTRVGGS